MIKKIIHTKKAPEAIGVYSQAVSVTNAKSIVYLSGQIPLSPETMALVSSDIREQIHQVFKNLSTVCDASGGTLSDIVKLNVYLSDLSNFACVNEVMISYFNKPYPARAAIGVSELPKGSLVEMDAILAI